MKVALVGCGKEKLEHAAPARDLYTGPLFRAARAWAEVNAARWFILSAKHGLLAPETVVEPYDLALASLSSAEHEKWAAHTAAEIARRTEAYDSMIVLAGAPYERTVRLAGRHYECPLQGLDQGKRLAWFKREAQIRDLYERMRLGVADGDDGLVEFTGAECRLLLAAAGRRP